MNFVRYDLVSTDDLVEEIDSSFDLDSDEFEVLQAILRRYKIVRKVKPDKQPKSIMKRLTIPLFAIVFFLIITVICPIKWVFTGDYYFTFDTKFVVFMRKWMESF